MHSNAKDFIINLNDFFLFVSIFKNLRRIIWNTVKIWNTSDLYCMKEYPPEQFILWVGTIHGLKHHRSSTANPLLIWHWWININVTFSNPDIRSAELGSALVFMSAACLTLISKNDYNYFWPVISITFPPVTSGRTEQRRANRANTLTAIRINSSLWSFDWHPNKN